MSLKDKGGLHNKSIGAYKASSDTPATSNDNLVTNEEISLVVRKFNNFYKSRGKERSSSSRYDEKHSSSRDQKCYNSGKPRQYSNECSAPHERREESPRRRSSRDESPRRERRSREDHYERRHSRRGKELEKKDKYTKSRSSRRHQAQVGEWVSGSESDNQSERSYHSNSGYSQNEGVSGLALVSSNSYDLFDSPNEGIGNCFMEKGPKVSHHEYFDLDCDEDDLLAEDDLLFDKASDNIENELENNHASKEKSYDDDNKEIE
ncbi:hypothetical protein ZWY2020_006081 [Hordeum vulgare]|nr:hypothetical protein ZWY2020_006081 [Hordeum vulgare]